LSLHVPAEASEIRSRELSGEAVARRAMTILALLFFVKAGALALFVTPLWDVPDESGHLSYALDLADGRGFPVYGRTLLATEVRALWKADGAGPLPFNWVAQHPPLYHLLAAPVALAGRAATADPNLRLKIPRLLTAAAAAFALLLVFQALFEASEDAVFALAAAGSVSFIPMYTHVASGTHHEPMLALAGGLVALGWVRFVRTGEFRDALATAAGLGLAGAIKLTALPVAAALLALMPRYLREPGGARKAGRWLLLVAAALTIPALWLMRNWSIVGHPLVYSTPSPFSLTRLLRLIAEEPVFDHTFKNFLGLIGWMSGGELRWFQISGPFLLPFLLAAVLAAGAAAVWLWRDVGSLPRGDRSLIRLIPLAVFAAALLPALSRELPTALVKQAVYAALLAVPFFGLALLFERADARRETIRSSQWVVLIFTGAYLWNVWRGHAIYGQMRAVHGRYFFAILPFLLLAVAYPAMLLWPRGRIRDAVLLAFLLLLGVTESAFFLLKVIPFYRWVAA
jgi:hypothetical protein